MVGFLNPMNDPSQTLGTERAQKTKSRIRIVGKGTVALDFSNQ